MDVSTVDKQHESFTTFYVKDHMFIVFVRKTLEQLFKIGSD